jgi:hypothetical protein
VKRKVTRQVTVPFTRKVKVAVKTTKIVPCMEEVGEADIALCVTCVLRTHQQHEINAAKTNSLIFTKHSPHSLPVSPQRRIRTTKLVEVPVMQMVDEEYTEIEERQAVRDKEIWVKKIVPETYIERVPVRKTRQVQRNGTEIREVEDWQVVNVPGNRTVEVAGYRIDEVEDQKMVEVEEFQVRTTCVFFTTHGGAA